MKSKLFPWWLRNSSAVLVGVLSLTVGITYSRAAAAAVPESAAPQQSAPRQLPVPVIIRPHFSADPTEAEIFGVPVLSRALVAVGTPSAEENRALAQVLEQYAARTNLSDSSMVLAFLNERPDSAWKPALLFNLGLNWVNEGRFSRAIEAWEEAWNLCKASKVVKVKALADSILGELVQVYHWAGNYEALEPLLQELQDRAVVGGASEQVAAARLGVGAFKAHDTDFRCGRVALAQLLAATPTNASVRALFAANPSQTGHTLPELKQIALQSGLRLQMVKRAPGAHVTTNSIVHWRLNHYGAVLQEKNGRFLVADSGFQRLYGHELWVSQEALDEESDGYFLIPEGPLDPGWQGVGLPEAQKVSGRGPTGQPNPNAFTPKDLMSCDTGTGHGMAVASAHLMLVSLHIVDEPVGYSPLHGPSVAFQATYNQRDYTSDPNPNYSNLGSKWTFNWQSYITDSGDAPTAGSSVTRYVMGGGVMEHAYHENNVYYADRDGGVLAYYPGVAGAPDRYELTLPDNSKLVYGQPTPVAAGTRKLFLTQVLDPAGSTISIVYDCQLQIEDTPLRIYSVVDALGVETFFHYEEPGYPFRITSIEAPGPRVAEFHYDKNGLLIRITDPMGISSGFGYTNAVGQADFIGYMTTPYGLTQFSASETSDSASVSQRRLVITDPNGNRQCVLYLNESSINSSEAAPNVPRLLASSLQYRNTFYFDKNAMSLLGSSDPAQHLDRAYIYHWLHDTDHAFFGNPPMSGILESLKPPAESRIWFLYPGEGYGATSGGITIRTPEVVARRVENPDDPNNAMDQVYQYTYDDCGRLLTFTDPKNRRLSLVYFPGNQGHLRYIRQTTGTSDELLAEYAYYNPQHRPQLFIDAGRQAYSLTWDAYGRPWTITNPKGETTTLTCTESKDGLEVLIDQSLTPGGAYRRTRYQYDRLGRIHTVTDSDNYTITCYYDALDRLVKVAYPDQTFDRYDYDRLDLICVQDRAGHRTKYEYDRVGRPLLITDPLGQQTHLTWCGCGGLQSMTDAMGHTTTWQYDLSGRLTNKVYHGQSAFQYEYETLSGRLKSASDPLGQKKRYAYNVDGTLRRVDYLNSAGFPLGTTPAVHFTYDDHYMRLLTATVESGPTAGTTTLTYNPVLGAAHGSNPGAGRLTNVCDVFQGSVSYQYDQLGRVLSRIVNGTAESVGYDTLGRVTGHNSPLGQFVAGYAGVSHRLQSLLYPNGQSTALAYFDNSGDNRLREIWHKFPNQDTLSKHVYDYDVIGQIQHWTQHPPTPGHGYTRWWENQIDALTPQAGAFTYDRDGQLTAAHVMQAGAGLKSFTFGYDAAGNRTSQQIDKAAAGGAGGPVSLATTNTFNALNQLTGIMGAQQEVPVHFKGRISRVAEVKVNNQPATVDQSATQPPEGRAFEATINLTPGTTPIGVQVYAKGGSTESTRNYVLNVPSSVNRMVQWADNGNCTADALKTYTWDAENRLTSITNNDSGARSEFAYDGFGRLQQILEKNSAGVLTLAKQFVWAGGVVCLERDYDTQPLPAISYYAERRFYPGGETVLETWEGGGEGDPELEFFESGLNGVDSPPIMQASFTLLYFTRDHLGSVREVTDGSGTVRARYDYDPYGRRSANLITGGAFEADLGFTGHYYHAPSGLHLTLFRAYDADTGRWLSRDPIGEAGGLNLYGYVGNNPISRVDPLGLSWLGDYMDDVGKGIYDMMMGDQHGPANPYMKGALDAQMGVVDIDRNNNVLRDSMGQGSRTLSEMGKEAAQAFAGAKLAGVAGGCSRLSGRTTYLYQKLGPAGEHLKFGITSIIPPTARYTAAQYGGGRLAILASGTRADMLTLERALHMTLPLGPEERQIFYRIYQWAIGLNPFPY